MVFDCTEADNSSADPAQAQNEIATTDYWVKDTDVECYTGDHLGLLLALGLPLLIVVTLGLPAWILSMLVAFRHSLDDVKIMGSYAFLFDSYSRRCYYWEVVVLARKAAIAIVVVFHHSLGARIQAVLCIAVLFVAFGAHVLMGPYRDRSSKLDRLEVLSLSTSIFAYFSGLLFNDPNTSEGGEVFISLVLIAALLGVFIYIAAELLIEVFRRLPVAAIEKTNRAKNAVEAPSPARPQSETAPDAENSTPGVAPLRGGLRYIKICCCGDDRGVEKGEDQETHRQEQNQDRQ